MNFYTKFLSPGLIKIVLSTIFFLICLVFAKFMYVVAFFIGRTHSVGAYISMWRAGKLNIKFFTYIFIITFLIYTIGIFFIKYEILLLITILLFIFHFFYDEIIFSYEENIKFNIYYSFLPTVLGCIYFLNDFFFLRVSFINLFLIFSLFLFVDFVLVRCRLIKLNDFFWFSRIVSIFILICNILYFPSLYFIGSILVYHYLFWFIYPVYKLHKYRREERDGFIIILVIVAFFTSAILIVPLVLDHSIFFKDQRIYEIAQRIFLSNTVVHILTTAPFAYYIGMPKKIYKTM